MPLLTIPCCSNHISSSFSYFLSSLTSAEVTPAQLEETAGLPISALTPKERATYWRAAGKDIKILLIPICHFIFISFLFLVVGGRCCSLSLGVCRGHSGRHRPALHTHSSHLLSLWNRSNLCERSFL
jgi:hypothetical protein